MNLFLRLSWLLLLLAAALPASASHLMGGEITYKYLDNAGPAARPFRYEVVVTHYINQNSSIPSGATSIFVLFHSRSTNNPVVAEERFARTSITTINPASSTSCGLPPTGVVGITLAVYKMVVNLPVSPSGYYAVCNVTARNAGILNVQNSGSVSMTLFSEMAPPQLPNTSPVFPDTAVVFICRADTSLVLNTAYDADGDRLSYSFGTPYGAVGSAQDDSAMPFTPLRYTTGFGVSQPFGAGGSAQIDPATGVTRYFTSLNGSFIVAVDVKEYRMVNGQEVLLGTTRRDVQLLTRTCQPNATPQLATSTGNVRNLTVVEGQTLEFDVTASDPEGQALTLRASSSLLDGPGPFEAFLNNQPGSVPAGGAVGSVSLSGVGTVQGRFRFAAHCGNARAIPYDVVLSGTDEDCNRKTGITVVRITVLPLTIVGTPFYCTSGSGSLTFSVSGAPNGRYQWTITGGTITAGQGTGSITVQVPAGTTTVTLSVAEPGSQSCAATFTIRPDNAAVQLNTASVEAAAQDRSITLALQVPGNSGNGNRVQILRRDAGSTGAYTTVGTVANSATAFTDTGVEADRKAYQYQLNLTNACGTVLSSQTHTTILTTATATQSTGGRNVGQVQVSWSAYQGFAVKEYQISRVADNGAAELVGTVAGSVLNLELPSSTAGFNQCFRVQAVSTDATARTSASNDACVTFENRLGFYNIITPNGDGKNDVLVIDNVALYPRNTLTIFSRWGRQVYQTRNYRNDYGGQEQAQGMYYYLFQLEDGTSYKGWFEVVR
ncbi:T9SS type B sorting domain-containing protein [Hymenobacter metallilatus]|uniref:Gliding motility-associated C-terminal domain-containing protein n=1 Tax=Hymenobacter metallilatus TaxID=2493666 RepID=A0A428JK71_9BACT|nr:gliding motility-associated C-terminal domain-containing protein [Hymenobacter metallilatus]RSK33157.1 gliding motility-associated C-terminal domain-containing protein [Hymenobacter metallilatus]